MYTLTDQILAYQAGRLSEEETVAFFRELLESGQAWTWKTYVMDAMRHPLFAKGV